MARERELEASVRTEVIPNAYYFESRVVMENRYESMGNAG